MALLSDPHPDLNNPALKLLLAVLISVYDTPIRARQIAQDAGLALGTFPVNVSNMREAWTALLGEMGKQNILRKLVELTAQDAAASAYHEVLRGVLQQDSATTIVTVVDAFNAPFLNQNRSFIDRESFRGYLRELDDPNGKRFVLVNGPSGSGKTYCFYLVETLAKVRGFEYCFVEMAKNTPSTYYMEKLATTLARDLKLPDAQLLPEKLTVEEKWAEELGRWLVDRLLQQQEKRFWIVLDGFDNSELPKGTKLLLAYLVDAIDKRLPNVRLLLLDYSKRSLPRELWPPIAREDALAELTRAQVESFVRRVFEEKQLELNDQLIHDTVDKMMTPTTEELAAFQTLDENEKRKERMWNIMTRAIETVEKLFPQT